MGYIWPLSKNYVSYSYEIHRHTIWCTADGSIHTDMLRLEETRPHTLHTSTIHINVKIITPQCGAIQCGTIRHTHSLLSVAFSEVH